MKHLIAFLLGLVIAFPAISGTEEDVTREGVESWFWQNVTASKIASTWRDYEILTAADTLLYTECGKTVILNSATEFATTLPSPQAGCKFRFIVSAAPVGTAYTVVTAGGSNLIDGIAVVNGASVSCADEDTITFTASAAISGDWVEVISDGTNWFLSGAANAATGIACSAT